MAIADVLRPINEKEILERIEKMDYERLKVAFKQTLNLGYFRINKLIIENTAIKMDKDFLNSVSEEIDEMREIVNLVDKYRG